MLKRVLHLVIAAAAVVLLAPLLVLLAIVILLDSGGPVFVRQERVGRRFRPFRVFRLRTLRGATEDQGHRTISTSDTRVTAVGGWLRRTRLEDLPQLLNVVAGDMALVGPRPEHRRHVELFREAFEHILTVRPGIMGADSFGHRDVETLLATAEDPEQEYVERILPYRIRLARDYVAHASLLRDATVMFQTVIDVLGGHAATPISTPPRRVLVVGAGEAGALIAEDMQRGDHYEVIGFIDDDPAKTGQQIQRLPVLGTRAELSGIMTRHHPHEVLIAIPRARPALMRDLVRSFEPYQVAITTLPYLRDLAGKRVTVGVVRKLSVEDLLRRDPVGLDPARVERLIVGKRVMVTGAAGSIGSELCVQICQADPAELVLFDRSENDLFTVHNKLIDLGYERVVRPVVGDVTDEERVHEVLGHSRPNLIFHAAAYKHVPMMERNACEAVKNNIGGTRKLAEAATQHGADRFILVSSDKAADPVSVMGATKRVAELVVLDAGGGPTIFAAVRFGNVLASSGSVVPRFLDQIQAGGPVTVTHPDARRYFMLIPEAVELVLQAAAISERDSVYVLDMGEQVPILDVARNLIRLSGSMPERDIPIVFTGLRPGERLVENLVGTDEVATASALEKINIVFNNRPPKSERLVEQLAALEWLAARGDAAGVVRQLQDITPSFAPGPDWDAGTQPTAPEVTDGRPEPPAADS